MTPPPPQVPFFKYLPKHQELLITLIFHVFQDWWQTDANMNKLRLYDSWASRGCTKYWTFWKIPEKWQKLIQVPHISTKFVQIWYKNSKGFTGMHKMGNFLTNTRKMTKINTSSTYLDKICSNLVQKQYLTKYFRFLWNIESNLTSNRNWIL